VHTLVLDEADSLLDMGFENEVNGVVHACSLPQQEKEEEEEKLTEEKEKEKEKEEKGDGGLLHKRRQTLLFSATWADPRVQVDLTGSTPTRLI
jgi:superfamily II DNA/RNA helicase